MPELDMFYIQYKHCHEFLRHKTFIISPRVLEENGIPVDRCIQQPGEWMITFPFGYHAGYNLDFNCAESVNFALDSWVPIGQVAKACGCVEDTVMIDVNALWGTQPKQCVLCPLRQSSALPQHDYYLLSSDMGAVHKVCAKAIDETRILHRSVKGMEAIPSSRWKLVKSTLFLTIVSPLFLVLYLLQKEDGCLYAVLLWQMLEIISSDVCD